jgi:hypothetical protein
MEILEMHLTLPRGREADAARHLWGKLDAPHRAILAALAAEVLTLHEARTGSTVVLVTGAAQAERVLRDLRRDQPPALDVEV